MLSQIVTFIEDMFGSDNPVLREIAEATGRPVSTLRGLDSHQLLNVIADAGIAFSDIPPHIIDALGLVPLRDR